MFLRSHNHNWFHNWKFWNICGICGLCLEYHDSKIFDRFDISISQPKKPPSGWWIVTTRTAFLIFLESIHDQPGLIWFRREKNAILQEWVQQSLLESYKFPCEWLLLLFFAIFCRLNHTIRLVLDVFLFSPKCADKWWYWCDDEEDLLSDSAPIDTKWTRCSSSQTVRLISRSLWSKKELDVEIFFL